MDTKNGSLDATSESAAEQPENESEVGFVQWDVAGRGFRELTETELAACLKEAQDRDLETTHPTAGNQ